MSTRGGETDETGKSTEQLFWFSSDTAPEKVFEVVIRDRAVVSTREFASSRKGGETPEQGFITEGEAIAEMRKLPGYENEEVLSIELTYGHGTGTWYWGIYTPQGAVSIKAAR